MTREELFNISEELDVTFLLADGFDGAIEGYLSIKGQEHLVCYNYDKCIDILINDTFHNKTIEKQLNKYQKLRGTKKEISNIEWSFLTFHEIVAFIHSISSLKKHSTNWDKMTFLDLLNMKTSLKHIILTLVKKASKTEYNKWIKRFFKRLVREDLLGKNMRPFSYDVAKTIS